jgi:hypothetical protein
MHTALSSSTNESQKIDSRKQNVLMLMIVECAPFERRRTADPMECVTSGLRTTRLRGTTYFTHDNRART